MYISLWELLLFSSVVLLKITEATVRCLFCIAINVFKGLEFALKAEEKSAFLHKAFSRIERNSIKNRGLSNTPSEAQYSRGKKTDPNNVNSLLSNLSIGKNVVFWQLDRQEVGTKFSGVTCNGQNRTVIVKETNDPNSMKMDNNGFAKVRCSSTVLDNARTTSDDRKIRHKKYRRKVAQDCRWILKEVKKIIEQSKYTTVKKRSGKKHCFNMNAFDKVDEKNKPNNCDRELSESLPLNVPPPQIVKCNPKSQSPDVADFLQSNGNLENNTIPSSKEQEFKDNKSNIDLHVAKQNNLESFYEDKYTDLDICCPGNPTTDAAVYGEGEIRLLKETSEIPDGEHNQTKFNKRDRNEVLPKSKEINGDVKLSSSQSDGNIRSCLNTENHEIAKVNPNTFEKNLASSECVDSAFQYDSKNNDNQLEDCNAENLINKAVSGKDEDLLIFDIPDEEQHPFEFIVNSKKEILHLRKDEVKSCSSQSDGKIASCSSIQDCENTKVNPNTYQKNLVSSEFLDSTVSSDSIKGKDGHKTTFGCGNNNCKNKPSPLVRTQISITLERQYNKFMHFLRQIHPELIKLENKILNIFKSYYCKPVTEDSDKKILEIRSKIEQLRMISSATNVESYHQIFSLYEIGIIQIIAEFDKYSAQNISNPNRIKRSYYLKQTARLLTQKRDTLFKGNEKIWARLKEIHNVVI